MNEQFLSTFLSSLSSSSSSSSSPAATKSEKDRRMVPYSSQASSVLVLPQGIVRAALLAPRPSPAQQIMKAILPAIDLHQQQQQQQLGEHLLTALQQEVVRQQHKQDEEKARKQTQDQCLHLLTRLLQPLNQASSNDHHLPTNVNGQQSVVSTDSLLHSILLATMTPSDHNSNSRHSGGSSSSSHHETNGIHKKKTNKKIIKKARQSYHSGGSSFRERLQELKEYKQIYGHCRVPKKRSSNTTGPAAHRRLAAWTQRLRRAYKKKTLLLRLPPPQQNDDDEQSRTVVSISDTSRNNNNNNGDYDDDYDDDEYMNPSKLTPDRVAQLEELGFEWNLQPKQTPWSVRYQELVEYYQQQGHSNVPRGYALNKQLGEWVHTQRILYRKKSKVMQGERTELLEAVQFQWRCTAAGKTDKHNQQDK